MIIDRNNCFQRNPEILQEVCMLRTEMANFILSLKYSQKTEEDIAFYQSELRHYKFYEI